MKTPATKIINSDSSENRVQAIVNHLYDSDKGTFKLYVNYIFPHSNNAIGPDCINAPRQMAILSDKIEAYASKKGYITWMY